MKVALEDYDLFVAIILTTEAPPTTITDVMTTTDLPSSSDLPPSTDFPPSTEKLISLSENTEDSSTLDYVEKIPSEGVVTSTDGEIDTTLYTYISTERIKTSTSGDDPVTTQVAYQGSSHRINLILVSEYIMRSVWLTFNSDIPSKFVLDILNAWSTFKNHTLF